MANREDYRFHQVMENGVSTTVERSEAEIDARFAEAQAWSNDQPTRDKNAIRAEAERRLEKGLVLSSGVRFKCDDKSVSRIIGIKNRPADRFPQSFKTSAGVDVTIPDQSTAVAVFNEVADYMADVLTISATLQNTLPADIYDDAIWPDDGST